MSRDISGLRQDYISKSLHENDMHKDPVTQFDSWFQEALDHGIELANAMVLATADRDGKPAARYVLLKEYGKEGFIFYTDSASNKGEQLEDNPQAALVLYWSKLHRQIRIEGSVELLPPEKADEYFLSRPHGSQITTLVAPQSSTISSREFMYKKAEELAQQFHDQAVPRPTSWLGYCVRPVLFEFWQGQENRLHDRLVYRQDNGGNWILSRIAP
jgi:pyridoxamine 5'-phosphate oxidase